MARITDPSRLDNIKKAAMSLIVEKGYRGASISAIADKAGVSTGYMYRHYNSKTELVASLIEDNLAYLKGIFFEQLKNQESVKNIVDDYIDALFNLANTKPPAAKFISVLTFEREFFKEIRDEGLEGRPINTLISRILEIGKITGELNPAISWDELIITLFTIPFKYILLKLGDENMPNVFEKKDIEKISKICFNALL